MHMTDATTHVARKVHRCDWCWQAIKPGESYARYRVYDAGDASTMKLHSECFGSMEDEAREEGGYFEWTPGMERPEKEPPHD